MANMTIKALDNTRFRAVCTDDNFKGKWRDTQEEAEEDGNKHLKNNPSHSIEIEFEQSGKMHFSGK